MDKGKIILILNKSICKFQKLPALILMVFCSLSFSAASQELNEKLSNKLSNRLSITKEQETVAVFIYFKDKGSDLDEKLAAAKADLTIKGFQRRLVNRGADKLVSFKDVSINELYLNRVTAEASKIRHRLKGLNAVSIEATPLAITKISEFDFVSKIDLVNKLKREPETQVRLIKANSPKSTEQTTSYSQALDYGASLAQNEQINIPAAHELDYSGTGVVIAVFDSGFNRLTHEAFSQMNIAGMWDFVNDDSDVGDQADMGVGSHGTNTLSTIGGYSPSNLIGPAFGATYYLAKTENTESELHVEEDNWCAAAEWADTNGADIITSSLGYTIFDTGGNYTASDLDGNTTIVTLCAELAAENGIVVINSAGNSGSGVTTIGAPSDGQSVLAVGAVTANGFRSSFSSVGPSADGRIKPDVMAMGSSVRVASATSDSAYSNFDGTSFSCPLTAGVAALVLEANNSLTAAQVRDILRDSADQNATPDNQYGYGIIDALVAVQAAVEATNGIFAPKASFAVVSNEPLIANFTNTSTDSDGMIISFAWDFGDGNTSSDENVNHTYAAGGNYSVSLTVTDSDGQSETVTRSISVASVPSNNPPAADPPSSSSGGGSFGFLFVVGLLVSSRKKL